MEQQKIKILVACHKPDNVYEDEVYTPIHVGRAISKFNVEMSNMIGDNTGDNISEKNLNYSELTAQYWAWKNINTEYIGLCHYRRYFSTKITFENIDLIFRNIDVILIRPVIEKINIGLRLQCFTSLDDFIIFIKCINKLFPEYIKDCKYVLDNNKFSPYNMFIMRKDEFDKFAKWQFKILMEMEKYVRLPGYSRSRRLYGYLSEILLTIYVRHNHLKVKYDDMVSYVGEKPEKRKFRNIFEIIRTIRFKLLNLKTIYNDPAVLVGFKIDNINIEKI